jgi:hypothetical protein
MRILLFLLIATPCLVSSFTQPAEFLQNMFKKPQQHVVRTDLQELTNQQADAKLNVQLHVGQEGDSCFAVTDMVLELHHEIATYEHPKMPGADGHQPHLSSGPRRLDVLQEGRYISMLGAQNAKTLNGVWEMNWVKDKPAGTLICGFDIPEEYKRNNAILAKGKAYLSFPVWTTKGLDEKKTHRDRMPKSPRKAGRGTGKV